MIADILQWIVEFVKATGYLGIFIMTFIESTFLPIPSEITMLPAGYLVHQGHMSFLWVMVASTTGTVGGAWINYWIAKHYGRRLCLRFGKYFFLTEEKLDKIETYFREHGPISIFTGRLIPGVRHYISLPAGLARMDVKRFCLYTTLGGGLWMLILLLMGYFIGANEDMLQEYMVYLKIGILSVLALLIGGYWWQHRRKQSRNKS